MEAEGQPGGTVSPGQMREARARDRGLSRLFLRPEEAERFPMEGGEGKCGGKFRLTDVDRVSSITQALCSSLGTNGPPRQALLSGSLRFSRGDGPRKPRQVPRTAALHNSRTPCVWICLLAKIC